MGQNSVAAGDSDETPKTPKNLGDMPDEIVSLIIRRSDFKEQLILRKTSKTLRALVDNEKPACTHLSIMYYPDGIMCEYDYYRAAFFSPGMEIEEFQAQNIHCHGFVQTDNYEERAFRDFEITLRNPKLRLEKLEISHTFYISQLLMEPINHRVFVRELELTALSPSCFLSILPFLRPGVLKKITIRTNNFRWSADAMHPVARLEQWIRCEEMHLHWSLERFPMEYAQHFKRFLILEGDIDDTKFVRFRNYLCGLQNFEECTLVCMGLVTKREKIQRLMGALIDSDGMDKIFHSTYHYRIPETNYYLEMKLWEDTIRIDILKKKYSN
ncbi:unnamed protein product [Caenorhabditis brenneri]